jgi:hypothetical protein
MEKFPDNRTFIWIIDNTDKIVYVNDDWLAFARENDAPALSTDAVLDKPLWRFIDGHETSHLYKQIFARIRGGKSPLRFPFRCDSRDCVRYMEMKLSLLADQAIQFVSNILRLEFRPPLDLLKPSGPKSEELLKMCSWCKKVYCPEPGWVEIEEAVRALDLFGDAANPQLTHAICDSCHNMVVAEENIF